MEADDLNISIHRDGSIIGRLAVELAISEEEARRGLMFRRSLEGGRGMLIRNPFQAEMTIWMRNTLIPLDVIFLDEDWRVMQIVRDLDPMSERVHVSESGAIAAIEVLAGTVARMGVETGDHVYRDP